MQKQEAKKYFFKEAFIKNKISLMNLNNHLLNAASKLNFDPWLSICLVKNKKTI